MASATTSAWVPLFSLCYFHHEKDRDQWHLHNQAHTLDGIIIGRSLTSNALLLYNPCNKQYYDPDSYHIDSYRRPGSVYCDIKYSGGLFCNFICYDNPTMEEKYPPGTQVERLDPSTNVPLAGIVMDIPFPDDLSLDTVPSYIILFDNGTSTYPSLGDG
jgi:hypothetical protein